MISKDASSCRRRASNIAEVGDDGHDGFLWMNKATKNNGCCFIMLAMMIMMVFFHNFIIFISIHEDKLEMILGEN